MAPFDRSVLTGSPEEISRATLAWVGACARDCADPDAVMLAVAAVQRADEDRFRASGREQRALADFQRTIALIDALIGALPAEDPRRMELWFRRGEIGSLVGERTEAARSYGEARRLASAVRVRTDLLYVRSVLEQSLALDLQGDPRAIEGYRLVLAYPWYTLEDLSRTEEFLTAYNRAASALIRRIETDAGALRELVLLPSADPAVVRQLEEARRRAGIHR